MKQTASLDPDEVEKFSRTADEWWDEKGPFAPLHRLNPIRLTYIREQIVAHFNRDTHSLKPFTDLTFLDVGCGGGLIAEPLTRLGSHVTGLDADSKTIAVAKVHAAAQALQIDYHTTTVETIKTQYDVVLALEIVEHASDPAAFVEAVSARVKPGGLLIMSTLNRTAKSFLLSIVAAEHILRWLPVGTHQWQRFLRPSELTGLIERTGLTVTNARGISYSPLQQLFSLSTNLANNYLLTSIKN